MSGRTYFDSVLLSQEFLAPRELLIKDVSTVCSKLFLESFTNTTISSEEEFKQLTAIQQTILKMVNKLDTFSSISIKNTNSSYIHSVRNAYQKVLEETIGFNPQKNLKQYYGGTQKMASMELLKQLFYFCFFAAIAYENAETIRQLLPQTDVGKQVYFGNYSVITELFGNKSLRPAFFVFVDHSTQNIIVSIRGLDSLQETVAFTLQEEDSLKTALAANSSLSYVCHQAYDKAASNIQKEVETQLSIHAASFPHYSIKLTGHSYGAGVAAMLTWKINANMKDKKLPNIHSPVRAVLFGSPPIFDEGLSRDIAPFIVSVVFGWDPIPSLSFATLYNFATQSSNQLYISRKDISLLKSKLVETKYQAGTVYWIATDERREKLQDILLTPKTNQRFHTLFLHERMEDDNRIQKTYAYLLAATKKLNDSS